MIGFKQPVAFLYHTGSKSEHQITVRNAESGQDIFEVFVSGPGFMHHLA
jgi:hypothetical protein